MHRGLDKLSIKNRQPLWRTIYKKQDVQEPAEAVMYFNKYDTRKNRPGINDSIMQYRKGESDCFRGILLHYMDCGNRLIDLLLL